MIWITSALYDCHYLCGHTIHICYMYIVMHISSEFNYIFILCLQDITSYKVYVLCAGGGVSVFLIQLVNISFIRFVRSDQTTCFTTILTILVFSSPELWARELFCLPVVRLDLSLRPSENYSHFRFSKSILE